jgi:hypothetical protein
MFIHLQIFYANVGNRCLIISKKREKDADLSIKNK